MKIGDINIHIPPIFLGYKICLIKSKFLNLNIKIYGVPMQSYDDDFVQLVHQQLASSRASRISIAWRRSSSD